MAELLFRNNTAGFRYELLAGDQLISQIDYTVDGQVVSFTHTGTPVEYRGRGLAGRLTEFALADLRAAGRRLVPLCPYTAAYVAAHPDQADLVVDRQGRN